MPVTVLIAYTFMLSFNSQNKHEKKTFFLSEKLKLNDLPEITNLLVLSDSYLISNLGFKITKFWAFYTTTTVSFVFFSRTL